MIALIIYCVFCYVFEIGACIAEKKVLICDVLFAPLVVPIMLGFTITKLAKHYLL